MDQDERKFQFELTEFQLQDAATWRTLDSALSQRDLVAKIHGGALFFLPIVLQQLEESALYFTLLAGIVFLCLITIQGFRAAQLFRLLQFRIYSAARFSRFALMPEGTYFSYLIEQPRMPTLRDQHDPMGLTVNTLRLAVLADLSLFACAAPALLLGLTYGRISTDQRVAAGALGAIGLVVVLTVARSAVNRWVKQTEARLSDEVVKQYAEQHVAGKTIDDSGQATS